MGRPTHFGKPTLSLRKYIAKLGKLGHSTTIHKAAVFNCHIGDDVCENIQNLISAALPQIKVFEKSLPVDRKLLDNWKEVVLPENWQEDASSFLSALLHFLS